jgi:hypothetical protein
MRFNRPHHTTLYEWSADAVAGEGAFGGLEAEHDVEPGNAGGHQLLADLGISAVVLELPLAVAEVEVDDGTRKPCRERRLVRRQVWPALRRTGFARS